MQQVSFTPAGVHPPACKYIAAGDHLVMDSWSSAAPGDLTITARVLTPDGQVQTQRWTHTPNTDRSRATTRVPLAEGFLLGVLVEAVGIAYARGQCWLLVGIQRGAGAVGVVHEQLIGDYVTGRVRLTWPGGLIRSSVEGPGVLRSVTGADPAAGAEISMTVPSGARWLLRALSAVFVTDATAGNRQPRLVIDDGTNILFQSADPSLQAASVTNRYSAGASLAAQTAAVNTHLLALPSELGLSAGWRIGTNTSGIVAGDNWGAPQLLVEEWIEAV